MTEPFDAAARELMRRWLGSVVHRWNGHENHERGVADLAAAFQRVHDARQPEIDAAGVAHRQAQGTQPMTPDERAALASALRKAAADLDEAIGALDKQTYDEHRRVDWDMPDDADLVDLTLTAKQQRSIGTAYHKLIAAADALSIPPPPPALVEGFVLVPMEPTEAMLRCGHDPFGHIAILDRRSIWRRIWRHMLVAAPAPGGRADGSS